jgi:hypothetical protein
MIIAGASRTESTTSGNPMRQGSGMVSLGAGRVVAAVIGWPGGIHQKADRSRARNHASGNVLDEQTFVGIAVRPSRRRSARE